MNNDLLFGLTREWFTNLHQPKKDFTKPSKYSLPGSIVRAGNIKVYEEGQAPSRMTVPIIDEPWYHLSIDLCPTCDKEFSYWEPTDPGDHFHQIVCVNLCNDCSDKSAEGIIPIHMFSEWDEVEAFRKEQGFINFRTAKDKMLVGFDHAEALVMNAEIDKERELYGCGDELDYMMEMSDEEAGRMAYFYAGGRHPDIYAEDYYDPHADLMRDREREMGVY
ncbi:MAG: hypothetical protein ABS904_00775 [Solibacillus isronensis]